MRAIEGTRVGGTRSTGEHTSVTRLAELPPPSPASMRAAARRRGAFAESLPTLRLQRLALAEVAQARSIEDAITLEVSLESDGVPVAIGPRITMELGSGDVSIADEDDDDGSEEVIELEPDPSESLVDGSSACATDGGPAVAACELLQFEWAHEAVVPVGNTVRAVAPTPLVAAAPVIHAPQVVDRRPSSWLVVIVAGIAGALGWRGAQLAESTPHRAQVALAGFMTLPQRTGMPARQETVAQAIAPQTIAPQTIAPPALAPAPVVVQPALPSPAPVVLAAAQPAARPKTTSPRRRRADTEEAGDEPDLVAASAPPAMSPKIAPNTDMLMRDALRAFSQSRWATAFHYTERARALGPNVAASRLAAISACHLGRAAKAEAAYRELPLGQRTGVRNTCRNAGVMLPDPQG